MNYFYQNKLKNQIQEQKSNSNSEIKLNLDFQIFRFSEFGIKLENKITQIDLNEDFFSHLEFF